MPDLEVTTTAEPDAIEASYQYAWGDDRAYAEDLAFGVMNHPSAAGTRVSERNAMGIAAVWSAVGMISGDVSKLPLELVSYSEDTGKVVHTSNKAHRAVAVDPGHVNPQKFWSTMVGIRLLYGEAFALIVNPSSQQMELQILLPDRTWRQTIGGQPFIWTHTLDNEPAYYLPEEVIHLEPARFEWFHSQNQMIKHMREVLGIALAEDRYKAAFYRSGGRAGGIISLPLTKNKEMKTKVEAEYRRRYEHLDAAFRAIMLPENIKFVPDGVTPADAEQDASRDQTLRDIARIFYMSPSKLGIKDSFSYNSKAEDNRDYVDRTLSHPMSEITAECTYKLLTPSQKAAGLTFEYDTERFLRQDMATYAQTLRNLKEGMIITSNEARVKMGLPKISDPNADILGNPNTSAPNEGSDDSDDETDDDTEQDNAAARMLRNHTRRMLNAYFDKMQKASKTPTAWQGFIMNNTVGDGLADVVDDICTVSGKSHKTVHVMDALTNHINAVVKTAELSQIPQAVHGLENVCADLAVEVFQNATI